MTKQDKPIEKKASTEKKSTQHTSAIGSPLPPGLEDAPSHLTQRVLRRNEAPIEALGKCVVYWMQRSQRAFGNLSLDTAIYAANALKKPLLVFFCLDQGFAKASARHFDFMLRGLQETAAGVRKRGAHFVMRLHPKSNPASFCKSVEACLLVSDENPLRIPEKWRQETAKSLSIAFFTVDSDVVVPSKLFPKEEYAARTLRPKIHRMLDDFLVAGYEPNLKTRPEEIKYVKSLPIDSEKLLKTLPLSDGPNPVSTIQAGYQAATEQLTHFVENSLNSYPKDRNHPEIGDGTSGLSPYLHFGQIDPRTVALAVKRCRAPKKAKDAFLEELIVRRELAINFVTRNPYYDQYKGLPEWGRKSLEEHLRDERPYQYSDAELEAGETHDPLWNAAQKEMIYTGKTHGYMRMYWAKKILEWSKHPEEAQKRTIRFNDLYFLDGRDPSGYANIACAIGGKHDHPWPQRPVFGSVRSMSFKSTSRKFKSKLYMEQIEGLSPPNN